MASSDNTPTRTLRRNKLPPPLVMVRTIPSTWEPAVMGFHRVPYAKARSKARSTAKNHWKREAGNRSVRLSHASHLFVPLEKRASSCKRGLFVCQMSATTTSPPSFTAGASPAGRCPRCCATSSSTSTATTRASRQRVRLVRQSPPSPLASASDASASGSKQSRRRNIDFLLYARSLSGDTPHDEKAPIDRCAMPGRLRRAEVDD
jgi:hypothetical protein